MPERRPSRFLPKVCPCAFVALAFSHLLAPFSYADDLLQIYELAQQQDPEIARARAQYEADHTVVARSRAGLLPSVTLSGSSSRNAQAPEALFSYGRPFNTHGYTINLQQSLFNMQAWYDYQSGKASDRSATAALAQAEQNLIMRVATAYFNVLRSQDALAAFRAEEEATGLRLEQVQLRFDVELEPVTELNAARASHDLARVRRLEEERRLNQRRLDLELITGRSHEALEGLGEAFPVARIAPDVSADWVAIALENSPDLEAAEAGFEAAVNDAKAARAALLPTFSVSALYNRSAETQNPFTFISGTPSIFTQVEVSVRMPLFNGGRNRANKRQAYHQRDASEQRLLLQQRQIRRDVQDSFIGVENGVLEVAANAQAIDSARSALQAVEAGVEVGTNNAYDVVTAQRNLYQARRDYANARYDYVLDTLTLKQAAGVLTPEDIRALNDWLE